MGRKGRNARKIRARTCAQKDSPKVQPPAPPPPETAAFPELSPDVIPLVLHAIFDGWDKDRDPVATCRAAVRWSTLNKTHREACADAEQVWDDLIARHFPNHTFEKTWGRELISFAIGDEFNIYSYITEPDPETFHTARDYYYALCGECIALAKDRERLRVCAEQAEKMDDYYTDRERQLLSSCELYWKEDACPIFLDLITTQHRVYMRMLIIRGHFFYYDFARPWLANQECLARDIILPRIKRNKKTMGDDWVLDFPDVQTLLNARSGGKRIEVVIRHEDGEYEDCPSNRY